MPEIVRSYQVDQLSVCVFKDRLSLGQTAARHVALRIKDILTEQEKVRMVFAAAPSQNEFLQALCETGDIDWTRVEAFHMDEYVGLERGDRRTFARYLEDHLFDKVHPGTVNLIEPEHPETACRSYAALIAEPPIDIVCLGIGENGHIAFNDPGTADFADTETMKLVELDEACRMQQVHDACFDSLDEVPSTALTLTIPALMAGRHLFCMVPGVHKANAVRACLEGPVSTACPASILRTHQNCTLYLDLDAYGGLHDAKES